MAFFFKTEALWSVLTVLILLTYNVADAGTAPIGYRYTESYAKIWDDGGSGADRDVSIWRPLNNQFGYYPLGDVAVATHSVPNVASISVREMEAGSLRAPSGFSEVWRDSGSGANADVRIFRMIPPANYACLGHVAINSYSQLPDRYKYRCVKAAYVISGGMYELIWKDRGSGADRDVAMYTNSVIGSISGVFTNTFSSFATHNSPSGHPLLLSAQYTKLSSLMPTQSNDMQAVTLFEQPGDTLELIWKDSGSGADYDVSTWRPTGPSGYYSLGDIAVRSHGRPRTAIIAKALKDDVFRAPTYYRRIWKDSGSGADWDVSFWEPICPPYYRNLGQVSVRRHSPMPSPSDIRCVNTKYTVVGKWQWIWNDRGSGADADVGIWQADPNIYEQGVLAMSTVASHGTMNRTPYVFDPRYVNYVVGKPAKKYIITNIEYLLDQRDVLNQDPEVLATTNLINRGSTEQELTRELSYTVEESVSWSNTVSLEVGIETEVKTGIPVIAEGKITVSVTTSYSHEWGGSETTSKTDTTSVSIKVKPHSQKSAIIKANRYTMDVPYVATLTIVYMDDSRSTLTNYRGVYEGVQVNNVEVVYNEDIPIF